MELNSICPPYPNSKWPDARWKTSEWLSGRRPTGLGKAVCVKSTLPACQGNRILFMTRNH